MNIHWLTKPWLHIQVKYNYIENLTTTTAFLVIQMSTYNNVLGNFLPPSDDLSDLDNEDYEDSASEPEPEMGSRNISSQSPIIDQRTQIVQALSSKSNKYAYIIQVFSFVYYSSLKSTYTSELYIF